MKKSEFWFPFKNIIILPDKARLIFLLKWIITIVTLFMIVYEGSNNINALRHLHYNLYFQWEIRFPFIPFFLIIYLSTFFSFFLPSLLLQYEEVNLLGLRYIFIIIFSGVIFLTFPTQLGFVRSESFESMKEMYSILYLVDKPYNLFPSLHISYSATTVFTFLNPRYGKLRWFLIFWLVLISISVVAVHQHHIADIAGGYIVSVLAIYIIRDNRILTWIKTK